MIKKNLIIFVGILLVFSIVISSLVLANEKQKDFNPALDNPQTSEEVKETIEYNNQIGKGYSPNFKFTPMIITSTSKGSTIMRETIE